MFVVLLMYQKGRESPRRKKKSFSRSKDQQPQHEEANIWYSSQAGLDTASLDGANKKKGPKNSLVSPCREGTRKYGYFHMLRLPSKSLVESLRLSHKIGLRQ